MTQALLIFHIATSVCIAADGPRVIHIRARQTTAPRAPADRPIDELPPDTNAARALAASLGPSFRIRHTPHFTLISDADAATADRYTEVIEPTWSAVLAFARRLDLKTDTPRTKLNVLLFDHWNDYARTARAGGFTIDQTAPGYYDLLSGRSYLFNFAHSDLVRQKKRDVSTLRQRLAAESTTRPADDADLRKRRREIDDLEARILALEQLINHTVVRHEIAHQVLAGIGLQTVNSRNRRWLHEGLAMQFENGGRANQYRVQDLLAARHTNSLLPLRKLVSDPTAIGPGGERLATAYAQAWSLVQYLEETRPRALADYIRATAALPADHSWNAADELSAFESAFGPLDAKFEAAWLAHVEKSPAP